MALFTCCCISARVQPLRFILLSSFSSSLCALVSKEAFSCIIKQDMRVLILSDTIRQMQEHGKSPYHVPYDVQLDTSDLNETEDFTLSVFDYDVSIVHIRKPHYGTTGYYKNLPKLLQDSLLALEHGHSIICLPNSRNFVSQELSKEGMPAYEWLEHLGVELRDNEGEDIKPSGAGRAQVIQEYLKYAPRYYQIVSKPKTTPRSRLAVVDDTEIVVGLELQVGKGILVILPPPTLDENDCYPVMSRLIEVARRYYDRSQRQIALGDAPVWLSNYLVPRAKDLDDQINKLAGEKGKYDKLAYVLYGTGDELASSVALLLSELGLDVQPQPPGANIDLKARHSKLNIGFAVEVTGTKDVIRKDSNKVAQAWQYLNERVGTPEENDKLVIIANSQYHLDPKQRNQEGYTPDIVKLLGNNEVLMITTSQLYEQWKAVHEGHRSSDDLAQELHNSSGLLGKSSLPSKKDKHGGGGGGKKRV
ncbi:hypothetical protein ES708_28174 [subsurface metagenome]